MITLYALENPYHNWDMIGYVASAESYQNNDIYVVHGNTYNALKLHVPENKFKELINSSSEYRNTIFMSADSLDQQLPYYQIRVLYIQLINLLSRIEIPKYYSTHFISAVSVFVSLILISHILFSNLNAHFIFSFTPIALANFGVLAVARCSTPDALAFLCSTIVFLLFLSKKHLFFLVVLPMLVLVRTDLIILTIAFSLYYIMIDRKYASYYIVSLITSLFIYLGVNSYFGNYGWHTIFYVTLIERITNPEGIIFKVSLYEYFHSLYKGLGGALTSFSFITYFLSSLVIFIYHIKKSFIFEVFSTPNKYSLEIIHYINIAFFIGHFILFPVVWDRFFVTQYTFTLILFFVLLYKFNKSKHSDSLLAAGV